MKKKEWVLSKTAMEMYMRCGASFDYYYNQGIRPIKKGSPLLLGSAVDDALNMVLENWESFSSIIDKLPGTLESFIFNEKQYPIGNVVHSKKDFDIDLLKLNPKDKVKNLVSRFGCDKDDLESVFEKLIRKQIDKEVLSDRQAAVLDVLCRFCHLQKAIVLIETFITEMQNEIKEVKKVQSRIPGGVIDMVAVLSDFKEYIVDNKTSTGRYPNNEIEYSMQLTLYAKETGIRNVAYIVMDKNLKKLNNQQCKKCQHINRGTAKTCTKGEGKNRCHGDLTPKVEFKAEIQLLKGEVTDTMINVASETREFISCGVKNKIFPCNFANCNNQFGKQCDYKDLKWKGSMKGMEKYK